MSALVSAGARPYDDRRSALLGKGNSVRWAEGMKRLRFVVGTCRLAGRALMASIGVCALMLNGCTAPPIRVAQSSTVTEHHVHEIAEKLPVGSHLRRQLEVGYRGSGRRQPWMDAMLRQGLRRALFRTEVFALGRPVYVRVTRVVYFTEYDDTSCSQVADPRRLSEISASGLEGRLIQAAKARTAAATWLPTMDPQLPRLIGWSQFSLFADEWLPEVAFLTGFPERRTDPLIESVSAGDLVDVTARLGSGVDSRVREEAVWTALMASDPCMLTALLR